jgi:hypothetical protein
MTIKPGLNDLLWMAAGAAMLLVLVLAVQYLHQAQNPTEQLAFKARKIELVDRMRLDLASASEAEKSAVMAITDEDSQTFADQARAASAAVERGRKELLLQTGAPQGEKALLGQFSQVFAEFQRIDDDVLSLAVKNTNLKASSLAFGPAAEALKEMDAALSHLVAEGATSPDAAKVTMLAVGARVGALRVQTMLPPHIAEESDQKMDEMEARMAKEEQEVGADLEGLAALQTSSANPDLQTARSRWVRFGEIKAQILKLSRENTNVRSLTISLDRKRKVMSMCQDALAALRQAIQEEPIAGVTYGRPAKPR